MTIVLNEELQWSESDEKQYLRNSIVMRRSHLHNEGIRDLVL